MKIFLCLPGVDGICDNTAADPGDYRENEELVLVPEWDEDERPF